MNTFMKTLCSLLVAFTVTKEELSYLQTVFKQINTSRDGQITREQLSKFSQEKLKTTFNINFSKLDLRQKGSLDYLDFITVAYDHKKLFTEKTVVAIFNLLDSIDKNTDHKINIQNFKSAFTAPTVSGKPNIDVEKPTMS